MPTSMDIILPEGEMDHIAIVGLASRYAGEFTDTEKLWEGLLQARCAVTPIPKSRFNADAFYHPDPEHRGTVSLRKLLKTNQETLLTHLAQFAVNGGSFLSEDPAYFDGGFFNFVKTELLSVDPQQRLLLESVYHALENGMFPACTLVCSQ